MNPKRVIELIRVSTEGQAANDRTSIPSQRAINRRTELVYGLKIVRSIEISDVSGTAVLKCPEVVEMLEMIKDAEIHGVVAREFSRLMRPEDFSDYYILQVFADTRTVLYLPEGPIDFSNKMGRVYGVMQAAWAGAQRIEFLENGWNAKEQKRRNGGFSQSAICLPFGVTFKDNKWSYTGDAERVKEAFRLFLSGETSYTTIGRKLGIEPYNIKVLLKNPIYTGTRVIDKKRDPSPAGKYVTRDGRQGDRRKIQRAPEEVIRVKVLEPLISQSQFKQTQCLMELKRKNSWRSKQGYEHRFTYNGFLLCGSCNGLIYTKYRRDDYYVCKHRCGASYMRRDRLEPMIDSLFGEKLASSHYAVKITRALRNRQPRSNAQRVTAQLESLSGKRQRILDSYFEGVINSTERDLRLVEIERERRTLSEIIGRETSQPVWTPEKLAKIFRPFVRFASLNRESKRRLLATLATEIVAAEYEVKGIWIGLNQNRGDRDS
jgi:DNA invertase Pin-like site-specific DNA recombinase